MYKYLVFAYSCYYPKGGMNDCVGKVNTFEEAIEVLKKYKEEGEDAGDIYDAQHNRIYRYQLNSRFAQSGEREVL